MRIIQNEEEMISYYQLKKNKKKKQGRPKIRPKLGRKLSKLAKIGKKLVLCAFCPKKLHKNWKLRLIQNKAEMISYYQLTKIEK